MVGDEDAEENGQEKTRQADRAGRTCRPIPPKGNHHGEDAREQEVEQISSHVFKKYLPLEANRQDQIRCDGTVVNPLRDDARGVESRKISNQAIDDHIRNHLLQARIGIARRNQRRPKTPLQEYKQAPMQNLHPHPGAIGHSLPEGRVTMTRSPFFREVPKATSNVFVFTGT